MEPVTHGLLGALLGNLRWKGKYALMVLVMSSLLPDIDYLTLFSGDNAFLLYHRGVSHGILFLLAVPAVVGAVFSKIAGGRNPLKRHFAALYLLSFIGISCHLLIDVFNPYGIRLMSPLEERVYSVGSVSIFDPFITAVLLGSLYIARRKRRLLKKAVVAGVVLLCIYIAARTIVMHNTLKFARTSLSRYIVTSLSPVPLSLWRWWYVARTPGGNGRTGVVDVFGKKVYTQSFHPPDADGPDVEKAMASELVKRFYGIFNDPLIEAESREGGGTLVRFSALCYSFAGHECPVINVYLDGHGNIESTEARLW